MMRKPSALEPTLHSVISNPATLTFGRLRAHLRQQAGMTIDDLAAAVGYHRSHITNLEKGRRLPDLASVLEKFIPALRLQDEPQQARRLLELAAAARGQRVPATLSGTLEKGQAVSVAVAEASSQLPPFLSSILGRERDITTICHRLLGHTGRIFTLIGPPGIGKTTLGLAVASRLQPSFADGVYFIPLATVTDPEMIGPAMMAVLGLTEGGQSNKSPKIRLIEYLRRKKILCVLDNFEQITLGASLLRDLVAECADLCLLVTSRSALRLRIEQRFKVPALDMTSAVELFVQRAQAIEPDFILNAANRSNIEQICKQLDCLPLAIELVAARIDLFTPSMLLARLQNQVLDLLHHEALDRDPRHRTLRHAIQHSYALLNEEEQALFRQAGIFVGGFDLASIQTLRGTQEPTGKVEHLLSNLLSKSMILTETPVNGERRFKLLETLRVYALEQLRAHNELEQSQQSHAKYFCWLAETAEPELYGPQIMPWLERLTVEIDNLRAALAWALSNPPLATPEQVEIGMRLAGALYWFWYTHSYLSEAIFWLQRALACDSRGVPALRAKVLLAIPHLVWHHRIPDTDYWLPTWTTECVALYRQLDDKRNLARALRKMAYGIKSYAEYIPFVQEAKQLYQTIDDKWGVALLSILEYVVLQPHALHLPIRESVALFREVGCKLGLAVSLLVTARQAYYRGDFTLARASIEEAIAHYREVGHKWTTADCLRFLGDLLRCQREFTNVNAIYEEAILFAQRCAASDLRASIRYGQGLLAYLQGDQHRATQLFCDNLRFWWQLSPDATWGIAANLRGMALIASTQSAFAQSVCLLAAADKLHSIIQLPDWPHEADLFPNSLAAARAQLDVATFASAWEQGRALSVEEAMTYALDLM